MIETIIAFLSANQAAIGATVSIGEGIVVLANLSKCVLRTDSHSWRKFRDNNGGEVDFMSASPPRFKAFLWVVNPLNVFRKPA